MKVIFAKYALSTSRLRKAAVMVFSTAALLLLALPVHAADLVTNGGFESNGGNGQLDFNTSATDWSVPSPPGSYTFLYAPGTADTGGANGEYGNVALWGPGNGVPNGLPAASPAGGYFVGEDSGFQVGTIQQTINGLTVGDTYTLGFYWAAAQQEFFTGATQSGWQVSLGSDTQSTAFASIPSEGFSGWQYQTFNYTASSTSEVLSFLAIGGSQNPPFALLDGVTLNATTSPVPEPATLSMLIGGLMSGLGVLRYKRLHKR